MSADVGGGGGPQAGRLRVACHTDSWPWTRAGGTARLLPPAILYHHLVMLALSLRMDPDIQQQLSPCVGCVTHTCAHFRVQPVS